MVAGFGRGFGLLDSLRRRWMQWRWEVGDFWWLWRRPTNRLEALACFDAQWYCLRNALTLTDAQARLHYRSRLGRELVDPNITFREAGYRRRYPDVVQAIAAGRFDSGFHHYAEVGWREGREPGDWGVAEDWYLARYPEADESFDGGTGRRRCATATERYLVSGCRRGHSPNPGFDEAWYRQQYPEADRAVVQGLALSGWDYYRLRGRSAGHRGSGEIDELEYRSANPDVDFGVRLGMWACAVDHFSAVGWREGRRLRSGAEVDGLVPDLEVTTFDPDWYLLAYPEAALTVAEPRLRAAVHYLERGRRAGADPNPLFWERWYLETYPAVAAAVAGGEFGSGFEHFLAAGYFHGYDTNRLAVDEAWYLANNADVAAAIEAGEYASGLEHYLAVGAKQGRDPHAAFSERWYLRARPEVAAAVARGRWISGYHHLLAEGLTGASSPHPKFSEELYLALNPDVQEAVREGRFASGYEHLIEIGLAQKRRWRDDDAAASDRAAAFELARMHHRAWLAAGCEVHFAPADQVPEVSVLLVVHNAVALTLQCLESVAATTVGRRVEVVIVDNASTDATAQLLERTRGARILRNDRNEGFVAAANLAAGAATGRYLLFLNNDALVQPGALDAALARLQSSPRIGAVGARVVGCDGRLQEAGCVVWNDGVTEGLGAGELVDAPNRLEARKVDYCSGVFLLTPRDLFLELGGFDSRYAPAYYEEADYCLRLRERGKETWYEPAAVVYHLGQGSFERSWHAHELLRRNRPLFVERHHNFVSQAPRRGCSTPSGGAGPSLPKVELLGPSERGGQETGAMVSSSRVASARMMVLGMHRSGTSCVGRLLETAGCWVGDQVEMMPAKVDNPDGYWERTDFVAVNDAALALVDRTWDTVDQVPLPTPAPAALAARRPQLDSVLRALDRHSAWALKDPRATVTLPWIGEWIGDFTAVIVVRHPLEVARSLQRREGFPLALGLALWEAYVRHLPAAVGDRGVVLVRYEDLVADPRAGVERLLERCAEVAPGGPWGEASHARLAAVVKQELRHQQAAAGDAAESLSPQRRLLFEALAAGELGALRGPLAEETRDVLALHRQARAAAARLYRDLRGAGLELEMLSGARRSLEGDLERLRVENRRLHAAAASARRRQGLEKEER